MNGYVALDIGNVLCSVNFTPFLNDLSKSLNITLEDAVYFMNRSQKLHDLGLTVMKDELRDHFKLRSSVLIDELLFSWNKVVTPNLTVIDKFNELTDKCGIRVALLSNIGLEHAVLMEKVLEYNGFFQNSIKHFSCAVGARKPTAIYYQSFLMQYPEFKGCVYIDDLQENLNASKKFGFKTHRFSLEDISNDNVLSNELGEIEHLILGDPTE